MNRSILYLLTLGVFLTATSELIVGGILQIIADDLQISVALAGQLITAFSLSYAIGTPILVALTSRLERKQVLVGSLLVFIAGCLFALWGSHFVMLLASRVIVAVSAGLFLVVSFGAVSRLASPDKIGSAIGTLILGFSAAMVLGIPLGIAISGWLSWKLIFLMLAVLSVILLFGLIRLLPRIDGGSHVPFREQLQLLRQPVLLLTFLFTFFRESGISMINTYVTPFLVDLLHFTIPQTGVIMLLLGLVGVAGSRLGGSATDRWGSMRILVIGMLGIVVSLALLPLATSLPALGVSLLAVAFGSLFFLAPSVQTTLISLSPESAELLLGINTSFIQLGLAGGAAFGGLLVHSTATVFYNPWGAALLLAIALGVCLSSFAMRTRKQAVLR